MKKYSMVLDKLVWVVAFLYSIIIVLELALFKVDDDTVSDRRMYDFNKGWTMVMEDGTRYRIDSLPFSAPSGAGEVVLLENTIPSKYEGMTLSFLSADKTLSVKVDDEVVYEFGVDDERLFGHTPGSIYNFIEIPDNFRYGHIEITMQSPYKDYASNVGKMLIGNSAISVLHLLKINATNILCNVFMLISSIVFVFLAIMNASSKRGSKGLGYLSVFCFIASVYYCIETKCVSLFYENQTLYSILIFLILMALPINMCQYYKKSWEESYAPKLNVVITLCYINVFVQVFLQLFDIMDFMEMASISHMLLFLTIIAGLVLSFDRIRRYKSFDSILEFVSLLCMGSGAVIDLARSYVVLAGDFGKFSRVGMTIYCVVMVVDNVFKISKSYADSVKENAKLLENEVKTMEEQNWKLLIAKSEAEEARKEANAANVAKSNFLANMSHEIRTPINAVLGMDAMILRESNQNEIREYALDIQNAGQTLLSLVNDILDFSKVESGRMEILPAKYDISSIINDCYNMVAPAAKEKGVALKMENDHAMPYKLYGDEVRIRQIVLNILNNAVKYTHEGSVTLVLGYTPVDENNIIVKIKISDTGIGIAKDDINKIFDSFIRVEEGKNRNIQGTGLGLAITNQLVNLMGGHIEVESEYGSGTTFLVDIPQGVVDDKPIGDLSERFCKQEGRLKVYREKFRAPDAKILIVDDVPMNLKVMVSLLKRTRIAIDTAESGRECLEYITKKKYDIIFLDHMMPEMDGVEVLKRMKEMDGDTNKNKNTPVIMLTANAILGAEEEYVEMGFNDYMSKPVNEDKLENMIMKYLPDELILQEGGDEDFTEIDTQDTFLGKLSFLDTEKGLAYCGGSEDVYREILESYVDTTRDSDLQQFYETRDWDNYRIQVHALKSTSLTIGAEELSKLAKDMEMAAREKDYAFIDEHHDDMMGMFLELLSKLRHILGCSQ